jgi:hypothetical protein
LPECDVQLPEEEITGREDVIELSYDLLLLTNYARQGLIEEGVISPQLIRLLEIATELDTYGLQEVDLQSGSAP